MNKTCLLAALIAVVLVLPSCGKSVPDPEVGIEEKVELIERKDISITKAEAEYVKSSNSFAFNLLDKVSEQSDGKSFIISPLSVTYCLGMIDNGAGGKTREEINSVLGFKDGTDELNSFCKKMLDESAAVDPSTRLEIANAVVFNRYSYFDSFSKALKDNFYADVSRMDFSKDDVVGTVNKWSSDKTHGMIPKIIDRVTTDMFSIFLNAIYFKGTWTQSFDKNLSKNEDFTLSDGTKKKVRMMNLSTVGKNVGFNDDFCYVSLPYGNGAFQMVLMVPMEGRTSKDIIACLDQETWNGIIWNDFSRLVKVKLPAFETEYSIKLNGILKALGMPAAFSAEDADFSNMTDNAVNLSLVLQKAGIKVDESGTEAAAVTVGSFVNSAVPPKDGDYFLVCADRPFIYAITEVSTGAVFFVGEYTGEQ